MKILIRKLFQQRSSNLVVTEKGLGFVFLFLYCILQDAVKAINQVIADVTLNLGVLAVAVLHDRFPVLTQCSNLRSSTLLFVSLAVSG